MLDNSTFGDMPTVTVPAQTRGTEHTLKALFEARVQVFVLSPAAMTFSAGSHSTFDLTIQNNGDFNMSNLRMKLNDPEGVFNNFPVLVSYQYPNYLTWKNCVNQWVSPVGYNGGVVPSDIVSGGSLRLDVGLDAAQCVVNSVAAGVYHLSFSFTFTASGGGVAPLLTVPWDVTVLG
jgi:hypothetical protein